MTTDLLQKNVDRLIEEGRQVLSTEFVAGDPRFDYIGGRPRGVDLQAFAKWQAGCINLLRMLGTAGDVWNGDFVHKKNSSETAKRMLGTLEAISDGMKLGLLLTVEDLIRAEAFDSLLGQADHLLSEGFFLAAGVLGRAVLEEHLHKLCDFKSCSPSKSRPTITDFKDSLYKARVINVTQMKYIEALASIGNDAAHNKGTLAASDVERMLRDVRDVLVKYPLSSV